MTKSLISIGQLDDEGYTCIYGDNSWKISKGSLQVAKGTKSGSLYTLHVSSVKDHVILVAEQPSVSLWHRRLGHMSNSGMKQLSSLGYVPVYLSQICLFVNIVCMVNKLFHHTKVGVLVSKSGYN